MTPHPNIGLDAFSILTPGLIVWKKNLESVYLDSNEECAKLFGFKKAKDLIGITDHQLHCALSDDADLCIQSDNDVITSKSQLKMIRIFQDLQGNKKILLINKMPTLNHNNMVTGTFAYCMDITKALTHLTHLISSHGMKSKDNKMQIGHKYVVGTILDNIKLTERQLECLFFLLRGKTAKDIGRLLRLSFRTVENYIEQLKSKFLCQTKNELISKAIERGFMNIIPERILETQLLLVY